MDNIATRLILLGIVLTSLLTGYIYYQQIPKQDLLVYKPPVKGKGENIAYISEEMDSLKGKEEDIAYISEEMDSLKGGEVEIAHLLKRGDSLSDLLRFYGISQDTVERVSDMGLVKRFFTNIQSGKTLYIGVHRKGDKTKLLYVRYLTTIFRVEGTLGRSTVSTDLVKDFVHTAERLGLSELLVMEFTNTFDWDLGDPKRIPSSGRFTVVYDPFENPLAIIFEGGVHDFSVFRYIPPDGKEGYYTEDGSSLRKKLLRVPLQNSRVSSNFNLQRLHPVLKTIRPHRGVDYAAPLGSDVLAAGDGVVIFKGVKGSFGNVIILDHGSEFQSLYAHLGSFNKGLIVGSKVYRGSVIGELGNSGITTGPHLHFELRKRGVSHNPLTVYLGYESPLHSSLMEGFAKEVKDLRMALESRVVLNREIADSVVGVYHVPTKENIKLLDKPYDMSVILNFRQSLGSLIELTPTPKVVRRKRYSIELVYDLDSTDVDSAWAETVYLIANSYDNISEDKVFSKRLQEHEHYLESYKNELKLSETLSIDALSDLFEKLDSPRERKKVKKINGKFELSYE